MQLNSENWTEIWKEVKKVDLNTIQLINYSLIIGLIFHFFTPES